MAHMRSCNHCGDTFTEDDADESLAALVAHIRAEHPETVETW